MISRRAQLKEFIHTLVSERENFHDYHVPADDKTFLTNTLVNFIYKASDKFILGSKEHNPESTQEESFLQGVDHAAESYNEIADFLMYHAAAAMKRKTST